MNELDKMFASIDIGKLSPMPTSSQGYDDIIQRAAMAYGIPDKVPIIQKMLAEESRGNSKAISPKGARGLMQLMPGTARAMGVKDSEDPEQNIFGGVRYLKEMYDKFGGDDALALAAYNAGPGAVKRAGGVPKFKETQNYVNKILSPLTGTMGGGFNDPRGDRLHYGGDISAEAGTSFIAPTRLKITNVREKMSNSPGGMVWGTDPATGLQFKFHHVIPGVKAGDMVEAGTPLGSLSSINGPHLDMKVYDPKKGEYIDWLASNKLKRGDKFTQGQPIGGPVVNPDASGMVADVTGQTVPAGVQNQQPPEKRAKISEILSGLAASMGPTAAEAAPPPKPEDITGSIVVAEAMEDLKPGQVVKEEMKTQGKLAPQTMPPKMAAEGVPDMATLAKVGMVDDPQAKFKILAAKRFPDENPDLAAKRYFIKDGDIFFIGPDDKVRLEVPKGILNKAKSFIGQNVLGRAPENIGSAVGFASGGLPGAGAGAAAGSIVRQQFAEDFLGDKPKGFIDQGLTAAGEGGYGDSRGHGWQRYFGRSQQNGGGCGTSWSFRKTCGSRSSYHKPG